MEKRLYQILKYLQKHNFDCRIVPGCCVAARITHYSDSGNEFSVVYRVTTFDDAVSLVGK